MKKGVLFVLSGIPKSPEVEDVKAFLREYWMDEWRNDFPFLFRKFRVGNQLLPKHSTQIASLCQANWNEIADYHANIRLFVEKIQHQLGLEVRYATRYQEPSIEQALDELNQQNINELMVIPMYPQSTMSTTKSTVLKVQEIQFEKYPNLNLTFLNSFYKQPDFIEALSKHIQAELPEEFDRLLWVCQNIAERHEQKAGMHRQQQAPTYRAQCLETAEKLVEQLELDASKVETAFVTLNSKEKNLEPDFHQTLKNIKGKVVAVPISYLFDDWETLGLIKAKGNEISKENGNDFQYIRCLNTSDFWANTLVKWLKTWNEKEN